MTYPPRCAVKDFGGGRKLKARPWTKSPLTATQSSSSSFPVSTFSIYEDDDEDEDELCAVRDDFRGY
jgi:hypothetical protein